MQALTCLDKIFSSDHTTCLALFVVVQIIYKSSYLVHTFFWVLEKSCIISFLRTCYSCVCRWRRGSNWLYFFVSASFLHSYFLLHAENILFFFFVPRQLSLKLMLWKAWGKLMQSGLLWLLHGIECCRRCNTENFIIVSFIAKLQANGFSSHLTFKLYYSVYFLLLGCLIERNKEWGCRKSCCKVSCQGLWCRGYWKRYVLNQIIVEVHCACSQLKSI